MSVRSPVLVLIVIVGLAMTCFSSESLAQESEPKKASVTVAVKDYASLEEASEAAHKFYKAQKYAEAKALFSELCGLQPGRWPWRYNLGCAQLRLKNLDEARASFAKVEEGSQRRSLRFKARYNLGQTAFLRGAPKTEGKQQYKPAEVREMVRALTESAAHFRRALLLEPKDADAARNLDWVRALLQQVRSKLNKQENKQRQQSQQQKSMEDLKQQQEQQAKANQSKSQSQQQAKAQQQQLSQQTEAMKQQQQPGSEARKSLEEAREHQQKAEQAMERQDMDEAARQQQQAAEALQRAVEQKKSESKSKAKKAGEDEGEQQSSLDEAAKRALADEKKARQKRQALLRKLQRAGIKPVERDW